MKIILLFLLLINFTYANDAIKGNPDKGQIYFKYLIAPQLKYNGAVFTKKFKKKKWIELFANDAQGFYQEFNIEKNSIDKKVLPHLKAFAITYSKDSTNHATCKE